MQPEKRMPAWVALFMIAGVSIMPVGLLVLWVRSLV